jgi:dihydroflavonol-4-reductase
VLPHLPADAAERLTFVTLDLTSDAGWQDAMKDCAALVHTASPFPIKQPRNPEDLIRPAVDGTERALRAAVSAGIGRVIVTSSSAAIFDSSRPTGQIFTEADWADANGAPENPYSNSKVMAERAAWKLADREGLRLTTINPTLILGPSLDAHFGSSIGLVRRLMKGRDPMLPRVGFSMVDVRDVALAHVRALERDETAGERLITSAGSMWLTDWGRVLKDAYPKRRIPTLTAPKLFLRLLAIFDAEARAALPGIGRREEVSAEKARRMLSLDFIPADEALRASAASLVEMGLV